MKKPIPVSKGFRRYHRDKHKGVIFAIVSAALFFGVVITATFLIYTVFIKQRNVVDGESDSIAVYIAKSDINAGEVITQDKLQLSEVVMNIPKEYYLSKNVIGATSVVAIPEGMCILDNMVTWNELTDGQREVECEVIELSANLVEGNYVDVRLMLPNGEDYIVLSKQSVHGLSTNDEGQYDVCYLWMTEEELLYYSAAIVDAYLYSGAYLYTTKYIEPQIQEASIITYLPSLSTLELIKENPNLVITAQSVLKEQGRKSLENRLAYYLNQDVKEVLWQTDEVIKKEELVNIDSYTEIKDEPLTNSSTAADAPVEKDTDYFLDYLDKEGP